MADEGNARFELAVLPEDERFLVRNRLEIVHILRGLQQRRELITAFFNAGSDLILTSVLDVDADRDRVILDYGPSETVNTRIQYSKRIAFVTALDKVKIQFAASGIDTTMFEGGPAFRISIPSQVLRLQRREYYRLTTPMLNPVKCIIPKPDGTTMEVALFDISAGGIGITLPSTPEIALQAGDMFSGSRVDLPGVGTLVCTLCVQNIFENTSKSGQKTLRAGCQFVDLRPAMESLVQRYILKLERERIAKAPGR